MMESLMIPEPIWKGMRRHVGRLVPQEGCGLLAGKQDRVQLRIGVRNADRSPVRFHMEPHEQWRAFQRIETAGLDLLAVYHSHPGGPDYPSATDIAEAMYPVVHIIWYRTKGRWRARGFHIEAAQTREVTLNIRPTE